MHKDDETGNDETGKFRMDYGTSMESIPRDNCIPHMQFIWLVHGHVSNLPVIIFSVFLYTCQNLLAPIPHPSVMSGRPC